MEKTKRVLLLAAMIMMSICAYAQNAQALYDQGYEAYNKKNYVDAIRLFTQSAQLDPSNIDTWYWLGQAYDDTDRFAEALDAFKRGVAAGDTRFCAFMIGLEYEFGSGVPASREEAAKWYRMAANAGDDTSKKKLEEWGMVYGPMPQLDAQYTSASTSTASVSSAGGNARELYNRGYKAYSNKNYNEAIALLSQSIQLDPTDIDTWYYLGQAYDSAERYSEALDAFNRGVQAGDTRFCAFMIGLEHEYGSGVPASREEAAKWYRMAANAGDESAAKKLQEWGMTQGPVAMAGTATNSYSTAAPAASGANAKELWEQGFKAHQDKRYTESIDLISRALAIEPDHDWWWYIQAENYEELGDGQNAVECYIASYQHGDDHLAPFSLGLFYEYGKCGVQADRAKAIKWYKLPARQGDPTAQKKLKEWGVQW